MILNIDDLSIKWKSHKTNRFGILNFDCEGVFKDW